ncbi:MAG: hypothetical protein JWR04_2239 [Rhodoglobus sp.]|jgi:very-short-patch-repair endonuclease|nr:hypothetical protein [Rhodoglobus sp.]
MPRILHRRDLRAAGLSGHEITARVRSGALVRIRRDHYALPGVDSATLVSTRVGGRLACVSALRDVGVFAAEPIAAHVHIPGNHSRSRSPRDRRVRLTPENRDGVELHWHPLVDAHSTEHRVGLVDALRQVLRCQPAPLAVASIDNALFLGLLRPGEVAAVFNGMPRRLLHLQQRVNGRSESGQESVIRWWLEEAGLEFEIQVDILGVGRVDFLVEGRLVIEADSRLGHSTWEQQTRDRDRDLELARRGIATLRPHYSAIMFAPQPVIAAVLGLLERLR